MLKRKKKTNMSPMPSFETAVERADAATEIIQSIGHQVCEGMHQASWVVPELGAMCTLYAYDRRQIVQDGEQFSVDKPFYLLHAVYQRDLRPAVLVVDFEPDFSFLRRRAVEKPGHEQADMPWDEAMSTCDEMMRTGMVSSSAKSDEVAPSRTHSVAS